MGEARGERRPMPNNGGQRPQQSGFQGQRPQGGFQRPASGGMRMQPTRPVQPATFEDKLSKFLKDSDDRMLDLKRNTESKRGGRGARRER